MAGGFFQGFGDFTPKGSSGEIGTKFRHRIFHAHVLDVVTSKNSEYYEDPRDIGKIRFRDLANQNLVTQRIEKNIQSFAYPLDRSVLKLPLPGEQVIIFKAIGDVKTDIGNASMETYFYSFSVSSTHNLTFNSEPFVQTSVDSVNDPPPDLGTASKRFTTKLFDDGAFKEGGQTVKVFKQLNPYEGDFILQGRFGQSIRFGSSTSKTDDVKRPWTGQSGHPVMTLRVERDYGTDPNDMYAVEDIDADDASIYLLALHKQEITLSSPRRMKSWEYALSAKPSTDKGTEEAKKQVRYIEDKAVAYKFPNANDVKPWFTNPISDIDQVTGDTNAGG